MEWFVYIIKTKNNLLYTGITKDIERRFDEHQNKKQGAKFLKANRPSEILYSESGHTHSSALKREHAIKKMTRAKKLELILKK